MLDSKPPLSTADLLRRINRMNLVGSGEKALGLLPRARELRLAASHSWLRLGLMLYDAKHYTEALECFEKSFETAEDRDNKFIALVWQGQLLDLMGKREAAMKVYRAAQATGSTQVFRHDQYNLKIDQTWVQERLQAPYKRE
jgi:tetratricopeptide (TPR) repeat protein